MKDEPTLPLCVFLDTEVFRSIQFDWQHPNLLNLRERVERGSVELVTTDIVLREIQHGIRSVVNEFLQDIQKAARHSVVARGAGDPRIEAVTALAADKIDLKKVWARASQFMNDLGVANIEFPTNSFARIFDLYFAGEPPFGTKNKKSEFPDAANLLALAQHAERTLKPIYVVSADSDWKRVSEKCPSIVHIQHLSGILDIAVRAEWLSDDLWSDEELLAMIEKKKKDLLPMLARELEYSSSVNLGDGKINHFDLSDVSLMGFSATYISKENDSLVFSGELFHEVHYEADASIDDDELITEYEESFSGYKELVAIVRISLPLANPTEVEILDVHYRDGLNLEIPLKY